MPTLALTNFNIFCATLGGFVTIFGLVSYLFKEKFYLSEALISLLAGVAFSPHGANFIRPLDYAVGSERNIDEITLYFSRLVLGVQLVIAGVQLPSRYLRTEWRSLSILLGPGMCVMWLSSSLLVFALVPHITFLRALAVGACVTPTDPVLSNSIVKGKFADANIPKPLQKIIIAESGTNDGLGYPFLFLALYLVKYNGLDGNKGTQHAIGLWFGETWGYTILLSVLYGIVVGWLAKELLHFAEGKKYVDRESFLVFAIALALFIVGTCGMIGSDDVLACFVAGNVFTWDDWFRQETEDDSLQPTIDMLLNITVFAWYGAVCPWTSFRVNDVIPIWRLILLGILILLVRRIPFVLAVYRFIPEIEDIVQAGFVGFFGPIGVSAVFYLFVSVDFLSTIVDDNGQIREDAAHLADTIRVVVWFLATCSIVVHGLSVPLGKFGYHFPRSMSRALSDVSEQPRIFSTSKGQASGQNLRMRKPFNKSSPPEVPPPFKIGSNMRPATAIQDDQSDTNAEQGSSREPSRPVRIVESPYPGASLTSVGQSTPADMSQERFRTGPNSYTSVDALLSTRLADDRSSGRPGPGRSLDQVEDVELSTRRERRVSKDS